MKNMSFALTTEQVKAQTKIVTRRLGWTGLQAGTLFCAVVKGMGLKPGEKVERLKVLRTVEASREPLRRLTDDPAYGVMECRREGFPELSPKDFVTFFCASHAGCTPETIVTRIEFEYVYTVLMEDRPMDVPQEVARCPYCDTALTVQVNGWSEAKDGLWCADLIDLTCESEPDIDTDEWDEWVAEHSREPYVEMLPTEKRVLAWLNSRYRWADRLT